MGYCGRKMGLKLLGVLVLTLVGCAVPARIGEAARPWDAPDDLNPPATREQLRNCAEAVLQAHDPETGQWRTLTGSVAEPEKDYLCVSFMGERWGRLDIAQGGGPVPLWGVVRVTERGALVGDRELSGATVWYEPPALLGEEPATPVMARTAEEVMRQLEEKGYAQFTFGPDGSPVVGGWQ